MIIGSLPLCSSRFFWFPNDINLKKLLLFYEGVSIGNIEEEIEIAEQYKFHVGKESNQFSNLFDEFIKGLKIILEKKYNHQVEIKADEDLPDYINSIEQEILSKSQQIFFSGDYRKSMMFVLKHQLGPDTSKYPPPHQIDPMILVQRCYKNYFDRITKQYTCLFNNYNIYNRAIATLFDVTKTQFEDNEVLKDMINMTLLKYPEIDINCEWEKILEFKSDENTILNQKKFMNWFNKLTLKDFNPKEYMQEFEFLLMQYKDSLNQHDLKYKYSPIKSVILNSGELVENIVKLNVSAVAKRLLNFSKEKIEYIQAKKNLAGSEIAYLVELKDEFQTKGLRKSTNNT